ncbi:MULTISPECIES: DUF2156 domain-containing protein [unclassified Arthrobacter]|uniref:bifunctional lysylphosphatidylglycerol flippase/synthetase MprF n=1 Tax=unclassified Arthrobacter TaxID=235627 RepID=UPI0024E036BB|nr:MULTISPECIES: DUF2156 domain-containing protein [unclassified Arthrobacter]MCC9144208.1 DUF2156 domain-containing protein [Arthrobacter sp. zg-Y919]MDK1275433.1 DUF2156 domain-containing protein [Arthrobacter sp. zg.Y919]WIB03185.1 DUF2156 domain-containing protein [Arthrobacter sp. zg-Y919]
MPVRPPSQPRLGTLIRWPLQRLRGSARRSPATLVFIACFWILGALTSSLGSGPEGTLLDWTTVSAQTLPGNPAALVLCCLWAGGPAGYIGGTLLAVLAGFPAERLLGTGRFLLAGLGGQIAGLLLTIGFTYLTNASIGTWSRALVSESFSGPVAFLAAVVAAASAWLGTLWRRRLRVSLFTLLILLALYSGSFTDLTVLGAAVAGAFAGPWLAGRRPAVPHRLVTSRREARVLVALTVLAAAVGPVISALSSEPVGPLSILRYLFTDVEVRTPAEFEQLCGGSEDSARCVAAGIQLRAGPAAFFLATLPLILLAVFSDGLRRGRRFAWWAALLLQGAMTVLAGIRIVRLLAGEGTAVLAAGTGSSIALVLPMVVPLSVLVLLAFTRRLFPVRAPSGTYRRLAGAAAVAALLLAALYLGGGLLGQIGFSPAATPGLLAADLPGRFLPVLEVSTRSPGLVPESFPAVLLYEGVGVLFWTFTCVLLLRSFLVPPYSPATADRDRARALLTSTGGSTMAWMTLWPGNSYWFAPGGGSYVAYRMDLGAALTVGEPVGPREELRSTVEAFAAFCSANGTTACFYSVGAQVRDYSCALDFSSLQVAEETVLPLGSLAFKGKKFQDLRTAMNQARKQGIRARWISYPTAPLAVKDQLYAISEEWVADKNMPEMGFTLGGLEEVDDPEVRCLLAIDEDGTVHAVTSWLPVYRDGAVAGWTLDFMRRRGSGFRLGMDFLIASAALSLQEEGYSFLSLSGAPLARAKDQDDDAGEAPVMDRLLDRLGETLEPVYGFRSLLAFKAKFNPDYVPLFMTYPDPAALPAIANVLARAYVPGLSLAQGLTLARRIVDRTG